MFLKGQLKRPKYLQPGQTINATISIKDCAIDLGRQSNSIVSAL
jgi:hypothetical protein